MRRGKRFEMVCRMPYAETHLEKQRVDDLARILPKERASVLEIGAREGHITRLLNEHYPEVTALDLVLPSFEIVGVTKVAGDVTDLLFPDNSFDCVFCTEVLEHIPNVEKACAEISRVAKFDVVVGVPFRQDLGVGRTTCLTCGKINPPWGHVNSFTEQRLLKFFPNMTLVSKSFVGENRPKSSALSRFLMEVAGNPWGTYDQDEPCIHCGAKLVAPSKRTMVQRLCGALATQMNTTKARFSTAHGNWIHLVLSKHGEGRK